MKRWCLAVVLAVQVAIPAAATEQQPVGRRAEADAAVDVFERQQRWLQAAVVAHAQAALLRFDDDFAGALALAKRGLALQQRAGSEAAANLWMQWRSIAENQFSLNQLDEAAAAYREAVRRHPQPGSAGAARLTRDLVRVELARGRRASAAAALSAARPAAQQASREARGVCMLADADIALFDRRYEDAITYIRAALDLRSAESSISLMHYEAQGLLLVVLLDSARDTSLARSKALGVRLDREFPDATFALAPFVAEVGKMRARLSGRYDDVLLADLDGVNEARASGDARLIVSALESLTATYRATHNLAQARSTLAEALVASETLPADMRAKAADRLNEALADIALDAGDAADARARIAHVAAADLLQVRLALLTDDVDGAREALLRAEAAALTADQRIDLSIVRARFMVDTNAGDAAVRAAYSAAIQLADANRRSVDANAMRLELATYSGDPADLPAENRSDDRGELRWRREYVFGRSAEAKNDDAAAEMHYRRAIDQLDVMREGLRNDDQRAAITSERAAEDLYARFTALQLGRARTADAWMIAERAKARVFSESLRGFRAPAANADAAALSRIEGQIVDLRLQLSPELSDVLRSAGRDRGRLQAELQQVEASYQRERQRTSLTNRGAANVSASPSALRDVQTALQSDEALIEFAPLPNSITAFVITKQNMAAIPLQVSGASLTSSIRVLRRLMAAPSDIDEVHSRLQRLGSEVMGPVIAGLPKGVSHLTIVPTGALHAIPFEALVFDGARAIGGVFTVSYLPNASTITAIGAPAPTGALFLGALGNVSVDSWPPLPGTVAEVKAIASIEPAATVAVERALTHERALAALSAFDTVHLATHGLLNERAPLFTSLLMSPAAGQAARVSLYELSGRAMRARTIVLSACETNRGPVIRGDEVANLTRTLIASGARTVVASLWEVADDSTAVLMTEFYRARKAGAAPSKAMQLASAAVRKTQPHPFFWAPFIVTGRR